MNYNLGKHKYNHIFPQIHDINKTTSVTTLSSKLAEHKIAHSETTEIIG
jgi:hypothetical protein